MASSGAKTVEDYLRALPEERRTVVSRVRAIILENLQEGYQESMNWGMIAYEVPLARYPGTYNKQPLMYMALAAQKHHYAVYSSGVYMDPRGEEWLKAEFEKVGKKLDMGKSCIRFRELGDLPLEAIGKVAAAQSVEEFIQAYEKARKKSENARKKSENARKKSENARKKSPKRSPKGLPKAGSSTTDS